MPRTKEPDQPVDNSQIIDQTMEDMLHASMMPYAEYVILERALPRVEDGLKPVQRRILYTMYELGLSPDKPHRKSARIVGDTMGKYHPHGDTSVYDAMVRMAQEYNMRGLLVDGHGNFGSIDGDPQAAMRYTEARMAPLALEMLRDIEKDTVSFRLNFDDTMREPDVLPARFPNLLVNGASGIAVGLATNLPPHRLGEVVDAVLAQMDDPNITLDGLMQHIKGPDFPTGGLLLQSEEIRKAYETGRGRMQLRALTHIENGQNGKKLIVIDEIPYQVNKAVCLEKILKLSEEKKGILTGIADIRDESDRTGMRAVIEVKKDADPQRILQYLYKYSDLQITFAANMVAVAEGKPVLLSLKQMIAHYITHQKDVVTRRTQYDLEKAKARAHILEGLIIAIRNIDEVIRIIRSSQTPKIARERLIERFELSEIQAQAILDMRLQRLTALEIDNLEREYAAIMKLIAQLEAILASEKKLLAVIKKELLAVREAYDDGRRTRIIEEEQVEVTHESFVVDEDCYVSLTKMGYGKRVNADSLRRSNRDAEGVDMVDGDWMQALFESNTAQKLVFFTNTGACMRLDCRALPDKKWRERGVLLASLLPMEAGEQLVACMPLSETGFLQFTTVNGMIKRTAWQQYNSRQTRIAAIKLREGDSVLSVEAVNEEETVLLVTQTGMAIAIPNAIPETDRATLGVKAITLAPGDGVCFAKQLGGEGELVLVSERGYAKRSLVADYETQSRGGKGLRTFMFTKDRANGSKVLAAFHVLEPIDIVMVQKKGETSKVNTDQLPIEDRTSKGQAVAMALMDNVLERVYRVYLA